MRELYLVEEECTEKFFVLRDDDEVRYQLAREALPAVPAAAAAQAQQPVEANEPEAASAQLTQVVPGGESADVPLKERTLPEPDPLYSKPLPLRPNEIQARIRAGATQEALADEMGVAPSRIETYAHPVVLERTQVAEAAKQSHPIREDGPAKLTLFEILATAFAARGHSLTDATWDATRDPGDDWVVHVRWKAGLTENEAIWSFHRQMGSAPTTQARNPMAADLTDPDFVQPVRSLTAVEEHEADDADNGQEDGPDATVVDGGFTRDPDDAPRPQKRKRKSATPHWEDVLLGVRANTKRPRK